MTSKTKSTYLAGLALALAAAGACAHGAPSGKYPTLPVGSDPAAHTTAATRTPTAKPTKTISAEQANATGSAKEYLDMEGFSRKGLIHQLSSSSGDGYSLKAATAAVDSLHVDWNAQAERVAKNYLSMEHFSRAGLIQQLESSAGEGFTHAQAVYGVTKAGL